MKVTFDAQLLGEDVKQTCTPWSDINGVAKFQNRIFLLQETDSGIWYDIVLYVMLSY